MWPLAACTVDGLVPPDPEGIDADVARALAEDIGSGDLSAALLPDRAASARIIAREPATVCGLPWALRCFAALDPQARFELPVRDGGIVGPWLFPPEQLFDVGVAELDPRRPAMVALARMGGDLHFAQQRVHFRD